jgi:hypothetical protein
MNMSVLKVGGICMKKQVIGLAICLGALVALTGCYERRVYVPVSQPPQVVSAPPVAPDPGTVVVTQAPPPAQVEVVPPAPAPGYVWSPGHWEWQGRWVWVGGIWIVPPQPGLVFVGPGWERHPRGGWVYHRGHWR